MELIKNKATADDGERVKTILDAAAQIPHLKNIDQWPLSFDLDFVIQQIGKKGVYLYSSIFEDVGTVDIRSQDMDIWGDSSEKAVYVHRLAVHPKFSGQDVGKQIIEEAISQAKEDGYDLIRLDCVTANTELRAYYEALGFYHVRDIVWAGGESSLYERLIN